MDEKVSEPLGVLEEFVSSRVKKQTLDILPGESWHQVVELVEERVVFGAGEIAQRRNKDMTQENRSKGDEVVQFIATKTIEGYIDPTTGHGGSDGAVEGRGGRGTAAD